MSAQQEPAWQQSARPEPVQEQPAQEQSARRPNRIDRRRQKIAAEIQRNRRGEYTVPTWVLAVLLVAIVGGIAALVILG